MNDATIRAWNNFVMNATPEMFESGSDKRAAAVASWFMGSANNGGLNAFLTESYELGSDEVLEALIAIGALKAASQLRTVHEHLGRPLPASTQDERWDMLDRLWTEELDDVEGLDVLSEESVTQLESVLEYHVRANELFYLDLDTANLREKRT